jgi:DNA-binding response OmpR family regulator
VVKPFELPELVARVRALVGTRQRNAVMESPVLESARYLTPARTS